MLSALFDHLWQSTLAALAAGLLVLALRKAPASARHGLWFAASIKFLIPFSALVALGRLAAPRASVFFSHVPADATSPVVSLDTTAIEKAAQQLARFPLELSTPSPLSAGPAPSAQIAHHAASQFDPALILLAAWALGFSVVLVRWMVRWARVRRVLREARPLDWPAPMPVLASPTLLEPGLVGFLRPVLVAPESLFERLTRSQIDAILAHETCHLRRRDNLTTAVHTLVEAVFWFHPMVWWIGTRMIAERERACDEAVVRAGHDRKTYARSLVDCARLYVQSPLSCVAGASGSNLKTRVEMIMTAPATPALAPLKKALLLAAGACACATPVTAGMLQGRPAAVQLAALTARPAAAPRLGAAPAGDPTGPAPQSRAVAEDSRAPNPIAVLDRAAPPADGPSAPTLTVAALTEARATEAAVPASATSVPSVTVRAAPVGKMLQDEAFRFVQKFSSPANPERDQIARWRDPVCVAVVGVPDAQAAQIKARIEAVARQVGVPAARAGCAANAEIVFTPEPQKLMDVVARRREELLGYYHRHDGPRLKTVTRPIQAWYVTATRGSSAAPVDAPWRLEIVDDQENAPPDGCGISHVFTSCLQSVLKNVLVVADAKVLAGKDAGLMADYLTMLTLTQPRSLDGCGVLGSVIDALAKAPCADREAPDGLTPGDAAYLTALYQADPEARTWVEQGDIAGRMAKILANSNLASR